MKINLLRTESMTGERASQLALDVKSLGYNTTVENIYTLDHNLVSVWTKKFNNDVQQEQVFTEFASINASPYNKAMVVGSLWHAFSDFVPWFLCQACAMVSTNEKRHYVIQTAFEELGMRNAREIHADMFWDATTQAGVSTVVRDQINSIPAAKASLSFLKNTILSYTTDEEVLGVLLGLEIPAIENIETVFSSLAHNPEISKQLNHHEFFRLHRQIEIEHVRLTVANFMRFCPTNEQQKRFVTGFMDGLKFWKLFWDSAAQICLKIERENSQ